MRENTANFGSDFHFTRVMKQTFKSHHNQKYHVYWLSDEWRIKIVLHDTCLYVSIYKFSNDKLCNIDRCLVPTAYALLKERITDSCAHGSRMKFNLSKRSDLYKFKKIDSTISWLFSIIGVSKIPILESCNAVPSVHETPNIRVGVEKMSVALHY